MDSRVVARAYDEVAASYEQDLEQAKWMRRQLRERALRWFPAGGRLLDVGCGLGADAVFFARTGYQVTAIDISPRMVAAVEDRIAAQGQDTQGKVEARVLDFVDAGSLDQRFDGIYSFFAALNTAPDLASFAAAAADLLYPGGRMLLHMLDRLSLWNYVALLGRGRPKEARARRRRNRRIIMIGDQPVDHFVRPAQETYLRYFAARFHLRGLYGMAVLHPLRPVRCLPAGLSATLIRLDAWAGPRWPLKEWGDFSLLALEKREVQDVPANYLDHHSHL
jgi:SAM-dependent methyltransferase